MQPTWKNWLIILLLGTLALSALPLGAQEVMNVYSAGSSEFSHGFRASQTVGDSLQLYDYEILAESVLIKLATVDPGGLCGTQQTVHQITVEPDWGNLSGNPLAFSCKAGKLYSAFHTANRVIVCFTDGSGTSQHVFNTSGLNIEDYMFGPTLYIVDEARAYLCATIGDYPQVTQVVYILNLSNNSLQPLHQSQGWLPHCVLSFADEYFLFWTEGGPDLLVQNHNIIQTYPQGWLPASEGGGAGFTQTRKLCGNYFQTLAIGLIEDAPTTAHLVWLEGNTLHRQWLDGPSQYPFMADHYRDVITHSDTSFSAVNYWITPPPLFELRWSFCHKTLVNGVFSDLLTFPDLTGYPNAAFLRKLDEDYTLAINRPTYTQYGFHLVDHPLGVVRDYSFDGMNVWASYCLNSSRNVYLLGRAAYDAPWQVYAFRLELGLSAQDEEVPPAPVRIAAFPNPFRSSCQIEVRTGVPLEVSLEVFNLRGQKVARIFTGQVGRGENNFAWDGKDENLQDVSSGVYLLRLTTSEGSYSRRIMLVR
ncbi:MAG: T9SS type A sorting domain-containing protein [Candidatus Cloacimonetes bacterium]|nr:T9SS type A sorting domain-containing protein [Candidatus Cloacimonadota bacterium]